VKNLFDYREGGDSLDDFLKSFPSVTREQAVATLELVRVALARDAHPAYTGVSLTSVYHIRNAAL